MEMAKKIGKKERIGLATKEEIEDTNRLNIELFNYLGKKSRSSIFLVIQLVLV